MRPEERLERYARLAVEVGSNIGAGQDVWVSALPEHAPLVRAIARCAYESGARYVDVDYADQHVRRARIQHADEDTLGWTPPWVLAKIDYLAEQHGAQVHIVGDPEPELLADLDGARVGKTRMRELAERYVTATNQRLLNWTIVAYPNEGWAESVFGEPDVERLWDAVASATRLDEPDPVEAWRQHIQKLVERGDAAERAPLRLHSLPRARHRPHRRPDAALELVHGARGDRGRPPARRQHADGGGLHDSRPPPHRGNACARRSRWRSRATSSAISRCASRPAGRSR